MNLGQELGELGGFVTEIMIAAIRSTLIASDRHYLKRRRLAVTGLHHRPHRRAHGEIRAGHLRGFLAPSQAALYRYVRHNASHAGVTLHEPSLSWRQYHFGDLAWILEQLKAFVCEHDIRFLVSHSYGAVLALWMAVLHGIPVVAVAPPLRRLPAQDLCAAGSRYWLMRDFRKHWRVDELLAILEGGLDVPIIIVSGTKDRISPSHHCDVQGITHHKVFGNHTTALEMPKLVRTIDQFVDEHVQPRRRRRIAA